MNLYERDSRDPREKNHREVGHSLQRLVITYDKRLLSIQYYQFPPLAIKTQVPDFHFVSPTPTTTHTSVLELNVRACCLRLLNCYPFTSYSSADTIFSDATVLFSNWLWAKYRYRRPFLFFKQTSSIYYRSKTNRTSLTCDRPAIVGQLDFISSYSAAFAWWQSLQVSKFHIPSAASIIFTANSTSHGCTILKMHFNYAIYYSFSASRQWFTLVP